MQTLIKGRHLPSERRFNPPPAARARVQPRHGSRWSSPLHSKPGAGLQTSPDPSSQLQIPAPPGRSRLLRPTAISPHMAGLSGTPGPRPHAGCILPGRDAPGCRLPCPGWEIDSCHSVGLCPHLPKQMNIHDLGDAGGPSCRLPRC